MVRYRIEVGRKHDVKPGNIVGAIANEAGMDSSYIGQIQIKEYYSVVDLPADMPGHVLKVLKKAWVCGQRLNMSKIENKRKKKKHTPSKKGKKRKTKK